MAGDERAAEQLLAMLMASLETIPQELAQQLQTGNWSAIAAIAHKLKGSSRLCCTRALESLVQRMELAAKAQEGELLREMLQELKQCTQALRQVHQAMPSTERKSAG
jgi:HPt (histidine-containing phosphotransfer) domain-containing protein